MLKLFNNFDDVFYLIDLIDNPNQNTSRHCGLFKTLINKKDFVVDLF